MQIRQKLQACTSVISRKWSRKTMFSLTVLGTMVFALMGALFGTSNAEASWGRTCATGETTYTVQWGDTLGRIGSRYNVSWQNLAEHNNISNPNLIFVNQTVCIPAANGSTTTTTTSQVTQKDTATTTSTSSATSTTSTSSSVAKGTYNSYPYGQCTWWADQRFYQIHGFYVPWYYNSDAHLWNERAQQNGWVVSSTPKVGDIMVLEAGVQYASSYGHVGVVETVNGDGTFVASNMNWWPNYGSVTYATFSQGSGVSFVRPA